MTLPSFSLAAFFKRSLILVVAVIYCIRSYVKLQAGTDAFSLEPGLSIQWDFVSQRLRKINASRQNPGLEATDADVCTHCVLPGLSLTVQSPERKSASAGTGAINNTKLQRSENLTSNFDMALVLRGQIQYT